VGRVHEPPASQERLGRALIGVVAASGLVYPLLLCAVQLVLTQLFVVDVVATALWLAVALTCSVALVAAVRWGAARPVLSPWLLAGLAPPVLYEAWVLWPLVTA
jgi:hypothetical protein